MKQIDIVPINYIAQVWPKVGGFVSDAMAHAKGECNADQLKVQLMQGISQLMIYVDEGEIVGAVVLEWNNAPNDRIMFINAIGGKTSPEHTALMFDWARSQGATTVRGCARESVSRLWRMKYGFNEIYRMVERRL